MPMRGLTWTLALIKLKAQLETSFAVLKRLMHRLDVDRRPAEIDGKCRIRHRGKVNGGYRQTRWRDATVCIKTDCQTCMV